MTEYEIKRFVFVNGQGRDVTGTALRILLKGINSEVGKKRLKINRKNKKGELL